MVRLAAAALVALAFLVTPAGMRSGAAQTPTTLELTMARPVWQLREHIVATGRLTTPDGPLGGVPIRAGINGLLDQSPYATRTAPDGTYELLFRVEDGWGFGGSSLTAWFPGNDQHAASDAMTIFQVAPESVAPVRFTVDPPPTEPVAPGQLVTLTGTLRDDRGEPADRHSVFAVVDAGTDDRAFGTVDDQGRWVIDLIVPKEPGEWSEQFPAYRVPVVFEGDLSLAPAQLEIALTLADFPPGSGMSAPARAGGTPSPRPIPSPSPSPVASSPVASPTAETFPPLGLRADAPSWLPAWLPAWVASEVFVVAAGGVLCLVVGAALLSHARRG